MTSTTAAARPARVPGAGSLTGTADALRLMLRLDRIKLPAWVVGIAAFVVYYAATMHDLYPTQAELDAAVHTMAGPIGALLVGPGPGFDALTHPRFFVGAYALYCFVPTALMSIFCVARHTRAEEASGRAELMRANVLGRHATLTSALTLAVVANLVLAALVAGGMIAVHDDYTPAGSALFAASIAAVGVVFAALTALAVQLTESPGTATGIAGAALGVAFVVRAVGDMTEPGGSALSWFSPLAWSQQTAPFVLDRWWPLLLSLGTAVLLIVAAYALSTRRDVGAGILPPRLGPARAAGWLSTPIALSFRLRRAGILWWSASLGIGGLLLGALAQNVADAVDDLPPALQDLLGGGEGMVDAYLNVFAMFLALLVGAFVIVAVQHLRTEETTGRVDAVLATATGRIAWLGGNLALIAVAVAGIHLLVGTATGLGAWASTGRADVLSDAIGSQLTFLPATLTVLGVAAALFSTLPRAVGATWIIVGYGLLIGLFGPVLLDLPDWTTDLSPYEHMSPVPVEPFEWGPALAFVAVAVLLTAASLAAFRSRGLDVR